MKKSKVIPKSASLTTDNNKNTKIIKVLLITVIFVFMILTFQWSTSINDIKVPRPFFTVFRIQSDARFENLSPDRKIKTILIYTTLFGSNWGPIPLIPPPDYLKTLGCKVDDCNVIHNKALLNNSHAVLFHGRDMPDTNHLHKIRKTISPQYQRWAYFVMEAPVFVPALAPLEGLFNLTATFKKDSDIWMPYSKYLLIEAGENKPDESKNYAKGKENGISWIVSHCGRLRDQYVRILQKHYPVFVGGNCKWNFEKKIQCSRDCLQHIKRYKYYLAFENSFCQEYITEKYWGNPLDSESIPIVMGAGPYENGRFGAIPGSYIDVRNFPKIQNLVEYLHYLDKNDTAYNEYFKWKQRYKLWKSSSDWPFPSILLCKLCEIIQNTTYRTGSVTLSSFYGANENCGGRDQYVKDIISRSGIR